MKIALPFQEDTSLIFASKIAADFVRRGHSVEFIRVIDHNGPDGISERQFHQNLGYTRFETVQMDDLLTNQTLMCADAVVVSRVVQPMRDALANASFKERRDRPCFLAFHAGLELSPQRGWENRKDFDAYFMNKQLHAKRFIRSYRSKYWRHVSFGHPYAMLPDTQRQSASGNIYFFTQAISPTSLRSRQHIVRVLAAIARANPERSVYLKLRHLPHENAVHMHREKYDYPGIMERLAEKTPPNLKLTDCSMADALEDAAYCITCTSTAAIDAISAGVPVAAYIDYVDFRSDRLREPFRAEFDASGVITSLNDLLELRFAYPVEEWMSTRFRGADLFDEIEAVVAAFPGREPVAYQPPGMDSVEALAPPFAEKIRANAQSQSAPSFWSDKRLLRSSSLFEADWYLSTYKDVARSGMSPVTHYLRYGCAEGRNPGGGFDTVAYYKKNPDVGGKGMNALVHYLRHGVNEGRL